MYCNGTYVETFILGLGIGYLGCEATVYRVRRNYYALETSLAHVHIEDSSHQVRHGMSRAIIEDPGHVEPRYLLHISPARPVTFQGLNTSYNSSMLKMYILVR